MCSYFGTGIPQSRQGDWINHVMDVSDVKSTNRADLVHVIERGQLRTNHAGGELDFHTDTTDTLGLFCLGKAKAGGASRLVSSAIRACACSTCSWLSRTCASKSAIENSLSETSSRPIYSDRAET